MQLAYYRYELLNSLSNNERICATVWTLAPVDVAARGLGNARVEDNFEGQTLDTSKWQCEVGDTWYNNELQAYTNSSNNVFVRDGHLAIQANKETRGGRQYTSARLITRGKAEFRYGRFEARIKLSSGRGLWPAFWLLANTGKWPADGEIDIMENLGHSMTTSYAAVHYGKSGHQYKTYTFNMPEGSLDSSFNVFAAEWRGNLITFFVNNARFATVSVNELGDSWPFSSSSFYIILN